MMILVAIGMILLAAVAVVGILLWECRGALQRVIGWQETQADATAQELTKQVDEMHQALGGMAHSLKAVGHQVYNLNLLAGHAIHDAQIGNDGDAAEEGNGQLPRIVIEVHRRRGDGDSDMREMSQDDMPPELREKFRAFRAVYTAAMSHPNLPSCHSPESN